MQYGLVTTPQGGRVVCHQLGDGRWMWLCDACGRGKPGSQNQVRAAAADHLQARYSCAHPTR